MTQTGAYALEDIGDDPGQWREAAAFLAAFPLAENRFVPWLQRFEHWWRTNPAAEAGLPRGWLLRHGPEVVGFNGVIAFDYACGGTAHKALAMSTWMVQPAHRAQSMKLFLKYHALRGDHVLVNTTANSDVQKVFGLMKYACAPRLHSFLLPLRQPGFSPLALALGAARTALSGPLGGAAPARIIGPEGLDGVTGELREDEDGLSWRRCLKQLKWICRCPATHPKGFVGALDSRGGLTAFLLYLRHSFRGGRPYLSVVDAYWRDHPADLLGLARHVCAHPESAPLAEGCLFLALNTFAPEELFERLPLLRVHRTSFAPHYYHLPPALSGALKRCRLAEGDVAC